MSIWEAFAVNQALLTETHQTSITKQAVSLPPVKGGLKSLLKPQGPAFSLCTGVPPAWPVHTAGHFPQVISLKKDFVWKPQASPRKATSARTQSFGSEAMAKTRIE